MFIYHKQIIGLDVITESGELLGSVVDLIINSDTQEIEQYEIKTSLVKKFLGQNLLISRQQVISINTDKITVVDSIIKSAKFQPAIDS